MSKLIITTLAIGDQLCVIAALAEKQKLLELRIYSKESKELLGNIYVGKVQNVMHNINAAFIEIKDGVVCYYSLEDSKKPIYTISKRDGVMKPGDELMVQVCRERIKSKAPCVTAKLNFTGKYLVLTTDNLRLGLSAKLTEEEKARLKKWLEPLRNPVFGIIVRTNAKDTSKEELLREYEYLKKRLEKVLKNGMSRVCYSLLEEALPGYLLAIRDVYGETLEEIITDESSLFQSISSYLKEYQPEDQGKLRLYEDQLLPLHKLYRVETVLEEAQKEKIWLKSGGSIVIQQTEAFVVIDVNTGKFTGKKKIQETFRKINLEAAEEIAYQVRLRNLSGIILIDFINLDHMDHQDELLHVLQNYLRKDPIKGMVVDMTKLNIVEVTRQKVRKSLAEEIGGIKHDSI